MAEKSHVKLQQIDEFRWRLPREGAMRTDGVVYLDQGMLEAVTADGSLQQVANVATLPGIVGSVLAMPDMHQGYGFPIGGVAAFDTRDGVVSPGGVGYDINCGVRLLRTRLSRKDVAERLSQLVDGLFLNIPAGVGSSRQDLKLSLQDLGRVLRDGAGWAVKHGFGTDAELEYIESSGCIPGADTEKVSDRALERGRGQLGTLGSGNHFVEIGVVEEIYDPVAAQVLGLFVDQITVFIHTGSRGLGHQVCDDYLARMTRAASKYGIALADRQLCAAPVESPEGRDYLAAMAAAANFAFANRQIITHWVQETLERVLKLGPKDLRLELIYDLCHNIAKFEDHLVDGKIKRLCVHRKGATRAFPPHHPQIPPDFYELGQPVIIPGDMGRYSYVLLGTEQAYAETFGSTCHGAGRVMSRQAAKKAARGRMVLRELEDRGIIVRGAGLGTVVEEISEAYKDVAQVVEVVHGAGISKKVARLRPIGVVKG